MRYTGNNNINHYIINNDIHILIIDCDYNILKMFIFFSLGGWGPDPTLRRGELAGHYPQVHQWVYHYQ